MEIKEIDGSQGEGGGQILRTSLSLSACTGQPIRIVNIRSGRKKPGLLRQHLCCVQAVAKVCNAEVTGDSMGSSIVEFIPGKIVAGDYHFSMGSAGSTTLVFQTILPLLLMKNETSTMVFEGGTHNPYAPNFDFLADAFMPMLAQMGVKYDIAIEKYGFYPVGGGRWSIKITPPATFEALEVLDKKGDPIVKAKCIGAGLPSRVLDREKAFLMKKSGWLDTAISIENVTSLGAGNVVVISVEHENTCEVVESIGALGIKAEKVVSNALQKTRRYLKSDAPIGEYLADQLLLPLVIAQQGGCFLTHRLSEHTLTNIDVIGQLAKVSIKHEPFENTKYWQVSVSQLNH